MQLNRTARRAGLPVAALLAAMLLTACGGGGGNPGNTNINGSSSVTGGVITGGTTGGTSTGTDSTGSTASLPTTATSIQFVTATPSDKSIVLQGQGGNGRSETAVLTFKVVDTAGNPVAKAAVNFSTTSTNVKLNAATGTTDSSGLVSTSVNSGTVPTTFRVQATVAGSGASAASISTVSDTITVTTGLPVQRGFSVSVEKFNIDGWSTDGITTNVAVRIVDAFGNPVADGTPVVFQTNIGAIGTADRGGCLTVNGTCTVPYTSQAPRQAVPNQPATPCNTGADAVPDSTKQGVATICASSTDGTTTLHGLAYVSLSSHDGAYVFVDGSNTAYPNGGSEIDLGSVSNAKTRTVSLELDDVNGNPLPIGTTLSIVSPQGLTVVGPTPAAVPSQPFDPSQGSHSGSTHSVIISSSTITADASTCKPSTGTFTVQAATPGGATMQFPFKLAFTCP